MGIKHRVESGFRQFRVLNTLYLCRQVSTT